METDYEKQQKQQMYIYPNHGSQETAGGEGTDYVRKISDSYVRVKQQNTEGSDDNTGSKIKKFLGKNRNSYALRLIAKGDHMTEEDRKILENVQKHMEEEKKKALEGEQEDLFICSMTKCYIPGCIVHTIIPDFVHFTQEGAIGYPTVSSMDEATKRGFDVYMANPGCSCVEVYQHHVCVVSADGTVTVLDT